MRVAVVCRQHPLHFNGGMAIAAWNTARAAAEAGFHITFITARRPTATPGVVDGVRVVWLEASDVDYTSFHAAVRDYFKVRYCEYDLLHGHGFSASPVVELFGRRSVFHDHGSRLAYLQTALTEAALKGGRHLPGSPLEDLFRHAYSWGAVESLPSRESDLIHLRRYGRVIATSAVSQYDYLTRGFHSRVDLLHHCIYNRFTRRCEPTGERRVALFAGELDHEWKIPTQAIEHLHLLRDVKLVLIGRGERLRRALGDGVEYHGHLPEAQAVKVLRSCDVLFEPSIHHLGCNLTAISALAVGVPVIGPSTGGHVDQIGLEETAGRFIDLLDPESTQEAVEEVFADYTRYSDGAFRRYEDVFSEPVCRETIRRIYEKVSG